MQVTYIVTITDINPLYGGGNKIEYRFPSRRKAFKFVDDAMSRGYYVTIYTERIGWEEANGW